MKSLAFFWGDIQVYWPTVTWRHRCITADFDCTFRVGQIFGGWRGAGFRIAGFGFGVAWPVTEREKFMRLKSLIPMAAP